MSFATNRQRALLRCVHLAVARTGRGPSLSEVLAALGGTRLGWLLVARGCERRGLLCAWTSGAWRDLRLTHAGRMALVPHAPLGGAPARDRDAAALRQRLGVPRRGGASEVAA